jgi:hypothetical protein
VQVPGGWHVEVPADDGTWRRIAIDASDAFAVKPDTYNTVRPATELTTDRLRLVMTPQHGRTCVGMLSVRVETVE